MRRLRRAKIVATLGPASSSAEMIDRLFKAGADVFRINMSHTSQDRMRELVGMIRDVERDNGRPKSFSTARIAACSLRIASCGVWLMLMRNTSAPAWNRRAIVA